MKPSKKQTKAKASLVAPDPPPCSCCYDCHKLNPVILAPSQAQEDAALLKIMKIITSLLLIATALMAPAQADGEFAKFGYLEPRIHLKRLLEIAGEISGRQIIVTH
jgi:hypothetical protein